MDNSKLKKMEQKKHKSETTKSISQRLEENYTNQYYRRKDTQKNFNNQKKF